MSADPRYVVVSISIATGRRWFESSTAQGTGRTMDPAKARLFDAATADMWAHRIVGDERRRGAPVHLVSVEPAPEVPS